MAVAAPYLALGGELPSAGARGHADMMAAAKTTSERALLEAWPKLAARLTFARLGELPTAVEPLCRLAPGYEQGEDVFVKRDDLSSPIYGGNKVRTLEVFFGHALAEGYEEVCSTGAYGSNHALATVLHAARVGLRPRALLFPQPWSLTAADNLRCTATRIDLDRLPHWSCLPFGAYKLMRAQRARGVRCLLMPPGGATPLGALGYVSAALELAGQIERGELPAVREVIVGVGSTCTSAGLLLGLTLAARLGLGWSMQGEGPPLLISVRVTPWPVTSAYRIVELARRSARLLETLSGDPFFRVTTAELAARLLIDGRQIGKGYGRPSPRAAAAIERLQPFGALALDTTYAAKAAAGLLARVAEAPRCARLFWSTKSSAPLPVVAPAELERAPRAVRRWLQAVGVVEGGAARAG